MVDRKFAANLGTLFTHLPIERRFEAAASAGFAAVELGDPYVLPASRYRRLLASAGVHQVLINSPVGPPGSGGALGWGCLPAHVAEFRDSVDRALEYAAELDCPTVHVRSGLVPPGADRAVPLGQFAENVHWALDRAAPGGIVLTVEALNPDDVPHYLFATCEQVTALVATIGRPGIGVQVDAYHCHRVGDDAALVVSELAGLIAHVQVADAPGRAEPGTGEIDFSRFFAALDETGYRGWIGCEYHPLGSPDEGLAWRDTY